MALKKPNDSVALDTDKTSNPAGSMAVIDSKRLPGWTLAPADLADTLLSKLHPGVILKRDPILTVEVEFLEIPKTLSTCSSRLKWTFPAPTAKTRILKSFMASLLIRLTLGAVALPNKKGLCGMVSTEALKNSTTSTLLFGFRWHPSSLPQLRGDCSHPATRRCRCSRRPPGGP